MKPTVYFAGAVRGDRVAAETIQALIRFIRDDLDIPVLSEHLEADDPFEELGKKIGKTRSEVTSADIERQDIAWVEQATHVVAEISGASTGTGREIEYARIKGQLGKIPAQILCLYREDREANVSAMITGMTPDRYTNVTIRSYGSLSGVKATIRSFLLGQAVI